MINSNLPAEYLLRKGEKPWYQKQPAVQDEVERRIGGNEHQNRSDVDEHGYSNTNHIFAYA